jgi:Tfp pilus assembly protein PilF
VKTKPYETPADPEAACDQAMLLLEHEQEAQARQVLEPVLAAHPEHLRAHLYMAMALAKTDAAQARVHATHALRDSDADRCKQAEALLRLLSAEQ